MLMQKLRSYNRSFISEPSEQELAIIFMEEDDIRDKFIQKKKSPPKVGHGGSFARYLVNKAIKQRQQFDKEERKRFDLGDPLSTLFSEICIFVDGHTTPSQQELKHLMALHGGGFESFYRRPPVTHFVCSQLPLAKVRQLRKER